MEQENQYKTIWKLYKVYNLELGHRKYLVDYYRTPQDCEKEVLYLETYEKEKTESTYKMEEVDASLYPKVIERFKKEDDFERRKNSHPQYAIPLCTVAGLIEYGRLMSNPLSYRQFPDSDPLANAYIQTADNARSVMNFARQLGYRRK